MPNSMPISIAKKTSNMSEKFIIRRDSGKRRYIERPNVTMIEPNNIYGITSTFLESLNVIS